MTLNVNNDDDDDDDDDDYYYWKWTIYFKPIVDCIVNTEDEGTNANHVVRPG